MRYRSKHPLHTTNVFESVGNWTLRPPIAISSAPMSHLHGRADGVGLMPFFTACSIAATSRFSSLRVVMVSARFRNDELLRRS
jgi:hypothetical protein